MENKHVKKTENKKEYFKKYYKEHPEKFKKYDPTDVITCELCKSTVKRQNLTYHVKTKKHLKKVLLYFCTPKLTN